MAPLLTRFECANGAKSDACGCGVLAPLMGAFRPTTWPPMLVKSWSESDVEREYSARTTTSGVLLASSTVSLTVTVSKGVPPVE
jgi:hypothetical protein